MNENEEIRADVVLEINGEEKTIEMLLKESDEIQDCEKGKIVVLLTHDGNQWVGHFQSCDGENVSIKPIGSLLSLSFELEWFNEYLEEV